MTGVQTCALPISATRCEGEVGYELALSASFLEPSAAGLATNSKSLLETGDGNALDELKLEGRRSRGPRSTPRWLVVHMAPIPVTLRSREATLASGSATIHLSLHREAARIPQVHERGVESAGPSRRSPSALARCVPPGPVPTHSARGVVDASSAPRS